MNKFLLTAISAVALGGLFSVQAQSGFVVWANGGGCSRQMMFKKIENGKLGTEQKCLENDKVAASWVNISYDGMWIAWCAVESSSGHGKTYGDCDYHDFGKWDVYVAKIDNGNIVPAKPIKVENGYLPMWGMDENAKDKSKPKLLYYTNYSDQTIRKAIINPNGDIASKGVLHSTAPIKKSGSDAHTQGSPDGKFIAYRPNKENIYSIELKKDIGSGVSGCHPSWGPRSKYYVGSTNKAALNLGNSVKGLGDAFPFSQDYWQSISNDSYYDQEKPKLWAIGRKGASGSKKQTASGTVTYVEVDISNNGWVASKPVEVGPGVCGDIHIFAPGGVSTLPKISDNRSLVTPRVKTTVSGLQLIIESQNLAGNSAELFNMRGEKIASTVLSSSQDIIPLNTISNGKYILRINNGKVSSQESILISR